MPQQPQIDFSQLVSRFGLNVALGLWQLFNKEGSPAARAFTGAKLGAPALRYGLNTSGFPGAASYVGPALGGAGLGYGLSQIAGSNLPTKQKVGAGLQQGGELALALTVPYAAPALVARAIINQLQRSGSPQVAATGRALAAPALPVEGLLDVLSGRRSPRAAGNAMVAGMRNIPVLGGPIGSVLDAFGLGTKPTTGTMFRRELGSIFDRIPALKGTDPTKYNIDLNYYNSLPQSARDRARGYGDRFASLTPDARSNPNAYAIQAQNMLLNRFGANLPDIALS